MIVCPSCQKVNAGNPARCEFCGMSFARMTEETKTKTIKNVRQNTRMSINGLIGVGVFIATALVCNLNNISKTPVIVVCVVFGVLFGFPIGYALTVIKGDAKKGAMLGAVMGVLFGLVLSMMEGTSVFSVNMLRGIAAGAIGGICTALLARVK